MAAHPNQATPQQAEILRTSGLYSAAIDHFTAWLNKHPEDWWSIAHRGAARASLGDHPNAILDLNKALSLRGGRYPWALAQKGEAYRVYLRDHVTWKAGEPEKINQPLDAGLKAFDEALHQSHDYTWALAHKAALHTLAFVIERSLGTRHPEHLGPEGVDHFKQADAGFEKAFKLNPTYAWARAFQALLYAVKGEFSAARQFMGDALLVNGSTNLHQNRALAELYYFGERYDDAVVQASIERMVDPEERINLYFIAQSLHANKDPHAAAARELARGRLRSMRNLTEFMLAGLDYAEGRHKEAYARVRPLLGQLDVELAFSIASDPIWQRRPSGEGMAMKVFGMVKALQAGMTEAPSDDVGGR